jgi:hypothetical protein
MQLIEEETSLEVEHILNPSINLLKPSGNFTYHQV